MLSKDLPIGRGDGDFGWDPVGNDAHRDNTNTRYVVNVYSVYSMMYNVCCTQGLPTEQGTGYCGEYMYVTSGGGSHKYWYNIMG